MKERSVRWRITLLFCVAAGALLAICYGSFYLIFQRVLRDQFDQRLSEIAAPIIFDIQGDPEDKDVDALDLPYEYFEILDPSGSVLQRSKNLNMNLPVAVQPGLQTVHLPQIGEVRLTIIPFSAGPHQWLFIAGGSTREIAASLAALRRFALVLLPASLILTAAVFGFLSNQLLGRIDAVVRQLRQFVSDAAHEIRTPLAVLQGESELLLAKTRTTTEYENAARVMDSELKKLSRIVDSLFTLSMADAGELRIAPEPLYLEEILEESCGLAAPLANHKKIAIERNLQSDVLVNGDPRFLRQLFLIFLDNAVKYSPSGTRVRITLTKKEDVRVSFQDQGIGISKEDLPRIFERFFRAAPSTETQSGGLGLAIAQAIVKAHHGRIECESEPGRGSMFTVFLPAGA
ncbi:MAG TPA: HAMP domain-containing sensor histidine kinase [Terriglobia bacterium]|nr:HAMP domain-containing sensor histidine kinase [Terriglobia bacterium]